MRELKFRAWDKEDEFFIDDGALQFGADGKIYYIYAGLEYGEPELEREDITDEVIVEQYTGLKDKNGKEIYEGDIVDYNDDGECIGVVKYDAPEFYLDADATNWARTFLKGAPHQRIIGNIHENKELLG